MEDTVHGILQARTLEWVAVPFSRGFSRPRDQTQVSRITSRFFTSWATREAANIGNQSTDKEPDKLHLSNLLCVCLVTELCPTLCDPMDYSPPGSSVHGTSQARILEWLSFPPPGDLPPQPPAPGIKPASPVSAALQEDSLPAEPLGKPIRYTV